MKIDGVPSGFEIRSVYDAQGVADACVSGQKLQEGERVVCAIIRPVSSPEDAEVYNGKTAAEWYSMQCQQALHLAGALRVLKIIKDTLPHINGSVRSVNSLLEEIETVMPYQQS